MIDFGVVSEADQDFIRLKNRLPEWKARLVIAAMKYRKEVQITTSSASSVPIVIVGAGIHGAIAALNARRAMIVAPQMGGAFFTGGRDAFYLNSRNREPREGENLPGRAGALNYIPGGAFQPSDLNGKEYQTNDDLATAIRWNIAMANIKYARTRVKSIEPGYKLRCVGGYTVKATKVIIATGLGEHKKMPLTTTSSGFLSRFPECLVGVKNVAVIGAGDSGNAVVEAMMGQGPTAPLLDRVEKVDWYGQTAEFRECARLRYIGLAREFGRRIFPKPKADEVLDDGMVYYEGRYGGPYDYIINATGYEDRSDRLLNVGDVFWDDFHGLGKKLYGHEIYKVGPAANLPITPEEIEAAPVLGDPRTKNAVAIFRYAPRTAELARRISDNA